MDKKSRMVILWSSYYSYIVTGMGVLIPGAIMPYLLQEFQLGYDQGGVLLALQSIANLTASIMGGVISDYTGRKTVLAFGALCFVIGFGGMAMISSSLILFILFFITGLGWGIMNSLVNVVVNDTAEGKSSIVNLLHMFFAIGAFIAPFIVGFITKLNMSWRYSVGMLACLSGVLFIIFLLMPLEEHKKVRKNERLSLNPFKSLRYYLFAALLFMYVGTENSINGWLTTYLSEENVLKIVSPQDILSLFWVAIIIGRFTSAYLSSYFTKERLLLIYCVGGAVFFALFLLSPGEFFIVMCVIFMGLFFAGVYPTTVANASLLIKGSGTAAGIMMSLGGLGGAVVPYINGVIAEARGMYAGMVVIIFSSFILVGITFWNVLMGRRERAAAVKR